MIINIAGTSGSGKTHLVREFIRWANERGVVEPIYSADRTAPMGHDVKLKGRERVIHIVGAYGNAGTAGCDTIRDVEWVYRIISDKHGVGGRDVLYEGLFVMNMTRGPKLVEEFRDSFVVLQLKVPLAMCIASINARRAVRGEGPLRKKDNTRGNYIRAENYCTVMRDAGAEVIPVNRVEALRVLLARLGCPDAD